jgi:hypothetical protein
MIQGKLELTIKINELPEATTNRDGWFEFKIDCGDRVASVSLKPKVWRKLTDANMAYPPWVASITGSYADDTDDGFIIGNPNVQVFERKPKADAGKEG